jgi:uracil phosphoribosyltransferase
LRDIEIQQDGARFRNNLEKVGEVMAYEISKSLPYHERQIKTPLGNHRSYLLAEQPVLITIFRAGIPFFQGFLNFFNQSQSGFIGAKRSEPGKGKNPVGTIDVTLGYDVIPDINNKTVIIADPMLATGNSLVETISLLLKKGQPKILYIAAVISAPEGIQYLKENVPIDFLVWTVSLDERLDTRAFIYPGMGDAGDLAFGGKTGNFR